MLDEQTLVTVDIQELDDTGTPLIGRKTTDARLYLADDSIFREIREKLIGAETGAAVRMTVEPREGEQGEKRNLEVQVKQIKAVTLPDVTDEFVSTITKGKTTTAAAFTAELRESIRKYWDDRSRRRTLDAVITDIVARHEFVVPESLVRAYTDSLVEEAKHRAPGPQAPPRFQRGGVPGEEPRPGGLPGQVAPDPGPDHRRRGNGTDGRRLRAVRRTGRRGHRRGQGTARSACTRPPPPPGSGCSPKN